MPHLQAVVREVQSHQQTPLCGLSNGICRIRSKKRCRHFKVKLPEEAGTLSA